MPLVLEGPHPLERDRAAHVDVRRGHVDPELHAQRPPQRELALELTLRQHVDGVSRQLGQAHGASLDARPAPLKFPGSDSPQEVPRGERQAPSPDPQASPPHPPRPGGSVLLCLVRVRARRRHPQRHPPARPGPASEAPPAGRRSSTTRPATACSRVLRGSESRKIIPSDEIAPVMKQAIVAIEDKRFFEHRGVDVRGIVRAVWQDVRNKKVVQGGSTITQQFVKNAYLTSKRSISRKLKEAALAWQLEQVWSKDRILTAYLNTIYFGNGAYGIEQAAQVYFGHGASKLTLAEAALLAGIPADPSLYNPVTNPKAAHQRRREVLQAMLDQKDITYNEFRIANRTPLPKPEDIHLPGRSRAGAVLRRLRQAAARRPVRDAQGVRRRAEREDDDRPRLQQRARNAISKVVARPERAGRGARRARPARRARARDGRRPELPAEPVQPRGAGRAPARLVLQAVRARRRARAGDLPLDDIRVEAGDDRARRPELVRPQLRGLEPRLDRPDDRDGLLRQHGLRAADEHRPAEATWPRPRASSG